MPIAGISAEEIFYTSRIIFLIIQIALLILLFFMVLLRRKRFNEEKKLIKVHDSIKNIMSNGSDISEKLDSSKK